MNTVIIVGDPHLGKNLLHGKIGVGTNLNSRIIDQFNLLDWILDQAIEISADHIFVTGDIFEEPKPNPSLITLFISWLKKCQAYNIHIHLIMGNHDILRSGFVYSSPLDIINEVELENVSVYKNIDTIIIDTTAFTLIPFRDRKSLGAATNNEALSLLKDSLVYELSSIPVTYKKVLIGHLAIEGSIPVGDEIDDIANELFCPLNMFEGYDYIWMGHVHKPQIMSKKPYAAHIGSMDISNFTESDHKKHIVIFDAASFDTNFNCRYLPTRPLQKITISVPKIIDGDINNFLIQEMQNYQLNGSIVKIDILLESPDSPSINKSKIEQFLIKSNVHNIVGISELKKTVLVKKDNSNVLNTKIDVLSAIKKYGEAYIEENQRSDFINLSIEIYNSYKLESKE